MARMTLDELVRQLENAYGAELRAVVLYGSAAAGEQFEKRSDTNVLVLVEKLDLERMAREAPIARGWMESGNPPPLTLTVEEWRSSADIFPMEYADILERHRVLYGSAPFEGIVVDGEHLRLEVEQQAFGKLLQLRQGVLATGTAASSLIELLTQSLSTFMVIFRGVVRLHREQPSTDYVSLSRQVAELAGFNPDPFVRMVRHVRNEQTLSAKEVNDVLAGILAGGQQLVVHVNGIRQL
jgi:hypothetical protein